MNSIQEYHEHTARIPPECMLNTINTSPEYNQNAIKTQSKYHQNVISIPSKYHQNSTITPSRYRRNTIEIQPACHQKTIKASPGRSQPCPRTFGVGKNIFGVEELLALKGSLLALKRKFQCQKKPALQSALEVYFWR